MTAMPSSTCQVPVEPAPLHTGRKPRRPNAAAPESLEARRTGPEPCHHRVARAWEVVA